MRVSPRDLRGIQAEGLLTRFAILGPVAFVSVEVPDDGSAGTGLERPTERPAWGIVLAGEVALHGAMEQQFPAGTAFHIPAGPPSHSFTAPARAVIAGFAPLSEDVDTTDAGMRARGFESVAGLLAPPPFPRIISPAAGSTKYRTRGTIEAEVAVMGDWVFTRTSYGPLSGYTSGWCDLPHWGIVLAGDLALRFQTEVELLSAGDVYYCPAGPGGHRFQVTDSAVTVDYTPVSGLLGDGRKAEWRSAALRRLLSAGAIPAPASASATGPQARDEVASAEQTGRHYARHRIAGRVPERARLEPVGRR